MSTVHLPVWSELLLAAADGITSLPIKESFPHWFAKVASASLESPQDAVLIAQRGLQALHFKSTIASPMSDRSSSNLIFELASNASSSTSAATPLRTLVVRGESPGEPNCERLVADLKSLLTNKWSAQNVAEPSLLACVDSLIAHPSILNLKGMDFVVFGALARDAPTRELLSLGANVYALDFASNKKREWNSLLDFTRTSSTGVLYLPSLSGEQEDPGCSLIENLCQLSPWILQNVKFQPILCNFVSADNGLELMQLVTVVDAIIEHVCTMLPESSVCHWPCADEVLIVESLSPEKTSIVEERQVSKAGGVHGTAVRAHTLFGRSSSLRKSYYLRNGINVRVGPEFYMAKLIQQWRTTVARQLGTFHWLADKRRHRVSANVAPNSNASQKDVIRAMTFFMIRDLRDPSLASNPSQGLDNPMLLFRAMFVGGCKL